MQSEICNRLATDSTIIYLMLQLTQKAQKAREFAHLTFELRDRLRQFIQKKFRENNIDLTYEMQQVMVCLWKTDGLKQQELADRTLKDKASLTCLINNLVKRKLVIRREGPNDKRSKLIFLTKTGKKLGNDVEPWLAELYSMISRNIEMGTIKECMATVQQMVISVKTD